MNTSQRWYTLVNPHFSSLLWIPQNQITFMHRRKGNFELELIGRKIRLYHYTLTQESKPNERPVTYESP